MSPRDLAELCILQKDYHRLKTPEATNAFNRAHDQWRDQIGVTVEHKMVAPVFPDQTYIPYVMLKPAIAATTLCPLIIHTHGGPHVYFDPDTRHAEIMYYLSHGYVVACPNYRGSNSFPIQLLDKDIQVKQSVQFMAHSKSRQNLHVTGPEDVYAVTLQVMQESFVDASRITLRGGSFGSFINAHLLAGIKRGKFDSIYAGVHLSGGVEYPLSEDMPTTIPILITHSVNDEIAPFSDARYLMEKLLLRKLQQEIHGDNHGYIQTFVAELGDHHLISPTLMQSAATSKDYQELLAFIDISTQFIDAVNGRRPLLQIETYDQYKQMIGSNRQSTLDIDDDIVRQIQAANYCRALPSNDVPDSPTPAINQTGDYPYTPTEAQLKLALKDKYTGEISKDLHSFIGNQFKPYLFEDRLFGSRDEASGQNMLRDKAFMSQLVDIATTEKAFLQDHSDHFVLYHAGDQRVLQLYTFINIWRNVLTGLPATHLPALQLMRLFDYHMQSINNMDDFLIMMRNRHHLSQSLNYIPGFAERGKAGNISLIGNAHNTMSCTLWWYWNCKTSLNFKDSHVLETLFHLLGIYSPARVAKYQQLFKRDIEELAARKEPQAILQQLFIPYDTAENAAYLCQGWGEEIGKNDMNLRSPGCIKALRQDPVAFDAALQQRKDAFSNIAEINGYGLNQAGFNYAGNLQIRYFQQPQHATIVKTYVRDTEAQARFVEKITRYIMQDFADALANNNAVTNAISATTPLLKAAHQSNLGFFNVAPVPVNIEEVYLQQIELLRGVIMNPTDEWYRGILSLNPAQKTALHNRLRLCDDYANRRVVHLYSLCVYLQGYTYYDLLMEALAATRLEKNAVPSEWWEQYLAEEKESLELALRFSSPSAVTNEQISSGGYHALYQFLERLCEHEYDPTKHVIVQAANSNQYYENHLFSHDLNNAIESIRRYARLCKEKGYGRDIRDMKRGTL